MKYPGEQARFVKSSGYFEKKGAISITYKTVLVKVRNILIVFCMDQVLVWTTEYM
jgi:hypothetical protein